MARLYKGTDLITILNVTNMSSSKLASIIARTATRLTAEDLVGVTSVGSYAFDNYTTLESIELPKGVTSIGDGGFSFCTSMESITLPEGLISIGAASFSNCEALNNVVIPSSVTEILSYAFYGCTNLTTITILATTPPRLIDAEGISSATTTIYIPKGTLSSYQSASKWSTHSSKFVELES